jgi:DNA polymerase III delta prime subunit
MEKNNDIAYNYFKSKGSSSFIYEPISDLEQTLKELPPGIYQPFNSSNTPMGFRLGLFPLGKKDDLINFNTGTFKTIMDKCSLFFSDKVTKGYQELKVQQKMGILLYGPPGTGKTSLATLLMESLVKQFNAVCLDCTLEGVKVIQSAVSRIRRAQNNPIVIFIDEFDYDCTTREEEVLSYLDGTTSLDNSIFIGCTNYLEKIPNRIKERKSRIKHVFEVKALPRTVYQQYILGKLPSIDKDILDKFIYLAEENGLTIDQTKNALIDYRIDNYSIEDAIKEAKKYNNTSSINIEENDNKTPFE